MADETLPETDLTPYKEALRRHAKSFAEATEIDLRALTEPTDTTIAWKDPIPLRAIDRGRLRGLGIRMEIEDRRERIRRAAALAEKLVEMIGGEAIEVTYPRPKTVAGIAVLRARRIQLRQVSALTESAARTLDRVERAAAAYTLPRVYHLPESAL